MQTKDVIQQPSNQKWDLESKQKEDKIPGTKNKNRSKINCSKIYIVIKPGSGIDPAKGPGPGLFKSQIRLKIRKGKERQ